MESKIFSHEMDNKLIELVRKHLNLDLSAQKTFRDTALRENEWAAIAKTMSRTPAECRTRWRTIRDSYRKNKKKVKLCNGVPSRSKYDDENLRFLDDIPPRRRSKSSVKREAVERVILQVLSPPDGECEVTSEREGEEEERKEESQGRGGRRRCATEDGGAVKLAFYQIPTISQESFEGSSKVTALSSPRNPNPGSIIACPANPGNAPAIAEVNAAALEEVKNDIRGRFDLLQERLLKTDKRSENPVEIFFRSMASTVMTFSPQLIAEAKVKVCTIISELELKNLTGNYAELKK